MKVAARLFPRSRRSGSIEELRLFPDLAVAMGRAGTVDEALGVALQTLCKATGWFVGQVWLPAPSGSHLTSRGWYAGAGGAESFRRASEFFHPAPGVGLPGRAWSSRRPVWIRDVTRDSNFPRARAARACGLAGGVAVPVLDGDDLIAVIELFSSEPRERDNRFVDLLSAVAALLASFMRRRDAEQALQGLDQLKNALLNAVSHELRTPLTSVIGFARTLELEDERLSLQRRREFAGRLADNALKLDRILKDLLDLDRLTRSVAEPRRRRTDVSAVVRRAVEQSDVLAGHDVRLEAVPVVVCVDVAKVERLVENLLFNASRYTPPGTQVCVKVAGEGDGVLIAVEDSGPGVPEELRESIFQPFQRGAGEVAHAPGVGIGLSLVARFAELHGGRAWVEERPGGGSSFRAYLPDGPDDEDVRPSRPLFGRGRRRDARRTITPRKLAQA